MKLTIFLLLTLTILVLVTTLAIAQPGLPGGPGLPGFPGPPAQAPIDGGLGVLAAAGGAYAWKKLKRNKEECED